MVPDDRLAGGKDRTTGRGALGVEPRLHDLLDEPIVQLVMASDHVARADLLSLLARIRRTRPYDSPLAERNS